MGGQGATYNDKAFPKRNSFTILHKMRKLSIFLLLFLCAVFSRAQTNIYHPFPDSNAVWTEFVGGSNSFCPGPPNPNPYIYEYNFSYFIEGDTLLNAINYHKLYQSGWTRGYCNAQGPSNNWLPLPKNYNGAFRQDTVAKKVFWFRPGNSQECLLLDFSLQVGDTVPDCPWGCSPLTVVSIDSIKIGTTYRKQWNLMPPASIIEGIGSTMGLLEPLCPFEYSGNLLCFAQNNIPYYPDTATSCAILTSLVEENKTIELSVAPNPFSQQTTIRSSKDLTHASIYLLSILGDIQLFMSDVSGREIMLQRGSLSRGIYFLKIVAEGKQVTIKKMIVE